MAGLIPHRNGPSRIRSTAVARQLVRVLIAHGWVAQVEHAATKEAFELVTI